MSSVPSVSYSGTDSEKSIITGTDGQRYFRTSYTLKYKELYNEMTSTLTPKVNIDVLDTSSPDTDDLIDWSYDRNFDRGISTITFHLNYKLSGKRDSIVSTNLIHNVTIEPKKHFYAKELTFSETLDAFISKSSKTEKNITTETITKVNNFLFNLCTSKVTTVHQTAKTTFKNTEIEFLSPEAPIVSYSGLTPKEVGYGWQSLSPQMICILLYESSFSVSVLYLNLLS